MLIRGMIFLLVYFFSQNTYAFDRKIFTGIGLLSKQIGTLSGAPSGEVGLLGSNYFQIVATGYFPVFEKFTFSPSFSGTPFATSSPERGEDYRMYSLASRLCYEIIPSMDAKLGVGLFAFQILAGGGAAIVNNGSTPTSFPLPGSNKYPTYFFLNLGLGYEKKNMRLDTDVMISGLANRRTTNILFSLTYGII